MRVWGLAVSVLMTVACGGSGDASPEGVMDHVGDAAASLALQAQSLQPERPLCAHGAQTCEVPPTSGGVVAPNGDALVRAVGGRSSQVILVRSGSDSAVAFGREGAGPGEYRAPVEIDLDSAGNVHVFDLFTRRLLRFAPDGTPAATGVAQLPPAPHPVMRFVGGAMWMLSAENPTAQGDTLPSFVYALVGDTAAARRHAVELQLASYGTAEFRPMGATFNATPQLAFGRDGRLVYAPATTAELAMYDATGRLVARGGFRTEGRAVTEEDVEAAVARQARNLPPGQMRDQILQRMRDAAPRHPGVTRLVVMADGTVWAREAPDAGSDSVAWLVYTAELAPQARVRMGVDDQPVGVHDGLVLVARSGEDEASTGYWWMRRR